MNTTPQQTSRPLGYWLKAVDRLMAAEFATAFESFGITRREWRLLNRVDDTVQGEQGPIPAHKLSRLIELGWVTGAEPTWSLTDEGRSAKERLGVIVDGIRAKVTEAVPAEDLATTIATLEQLARAFGWDENTPLLRRVKHHREHGHGFGPHGFGHGEFGRHGGDFGPGHFDPGEHPFAPGADHGHQPHHGRGQARAHVARFAQGAYERGFDAGFSRGRADS